MPAPGQNLTTDHDPTPHWVWIKREYGPDLAVGPYTSRAAANAALSGSDLVKQLCEQDALDCSTVAAVPVADVEHVKATAAGD